MILVGRKKRKEKITKLEGVSYAKVALHFTGITYRYNVRKFRGLYVVDV